MCWASANQGPVVDGVASNAAWVTPSAVCSPRGR